MPGRFQETKQDLSNTAHCDYKIDEIYIQLELSIIKITWHFSTANGQQVKDFWLYTMEEHPKDYNQLLADIEPAIELSPADLRFVLPATHLF